MARARQKSNKGKGVQRQMTLQERLTAVDDFVVVMKQRICDEENRGRNEWDRKSLLKMIPRLTEHLGEVTTAISGGLSADEIIHCCANLANYAMIFAHGLQTRGTGELEPMMDPDGDD